MSAAEPMIEEMCERYWNAYREGVLAAAAQSGLIGTQYPTWAQSRDPVKDETRRCMRHAAEALRTVYPASFDATFPSKPAKRKLRHTVTDERMAVSLKLGEMEAANGAG